MQKILKRWEIEFRKAAEADNLVLFRNHLHRLGLPDDEPDLLLHDTVLVVQACCVYASLDGQSLTKFLQQQKYCPYHAPEAIYAYTFHLGDRGFARVLGSAKLELFDLADLYGHPWKRYGVCGFRCLWVSRTDGEGLSCEELAQIQAEITEDLRFDYSEDELDFWFDYSADKGILQVNLQDVEGS